jgi:hypothetical protein
MQALYNFKTYGYFVWKRNKRPTLRAQRRITHFLMTLLALSVRARACAWVVWWVVGGWVGVSLTD